MKTVKDSDLQKELLRFLAQLPPYIDTKNWKFLDQFDYAKWYDLDVVSCYEDEYLQLRKQYREAYDLQKESQTELDFYTKLRLAYLLVLMVYFILEDLQDPSSVKCLYVAYNIWRFKFEDSSAIYQKQLKQSIEALPLKVPISENFNLDRLKRTASRYGFKLQVKVGFLSACLKEPTEEEAFVENVVRGSYAFNACVVKNPFMNEVDRFYLSINKNLKSLDKFVLWWQFIYGDMRAALLKNLLQAADTNLFLILDFTREFSKYKQNLLSMFKIYSDNYSEYFLKSVRSTETEYQPLHLPYLLQGDKVRVQGKIKDSAREDVELYYEGVIKIKLQQDELVDFDDTELILNGSVFAFEDNHSLVLEDIKKNYFTI